MLTIKSTAVHADTFSFYANVEARSLGEYFVCFSYKSWEWFELNGDLDGEELFGCLSAALESFEDLVALAEINRTNANKSYRNYLATKEAKEREDFISVLEDTWVKSSLLLVSEEADDEEEIYTYTYLYNGLKVTKTCVGLDVEMKVSVDGFILADDLYCFESGHWPTPEEYLIALLY